MTTSPAQPRSPGARPAALLRSALGVLGALALTLAACDADSDSGAPAGGAGSPGVTTASRSQNCATIDTGIVDFSTVAIKDSSGGSGSAGSTGNASDVPFPEPSSNATGSACGDYLTGCSDADIAALAPVFACYSTHASAASITELQSACPGDPQLSESCSASLGKLLPAPSKANCTSPNACWTRVRDLVNGPCRDQQNESGRCIAESDIYCFFFWYILPCS